MFYKSGEGISDQFDPVKMFSFPLNPVFSEGVPNQVCAQQLKENEKKIYITILI